MKTVVVNKAPAKKIGAAKKAGGAKKARTQDYLAEVMKLLVVAVGQRMPDWAQTAWDDYAKRFPPELKLELRAVKTEPRGSKTLETLYAAERERIEARHHQGHARSWRSTSAAPR